MKEIIHGITEASVQADARWKKDELMEVLEKASRLSINDLEYIAKEVGIQFTLPSQDVDQYLMVLAEADDKEKLKRLIEQKLK